MEIKLRFDLIQKAGFFHFTDICSILKLNIRKGLKLVLLAGSSGNSMSLHCGLYSSILDGKSGLNY
jgi:hypothetical protein